MLEIKAIDNKTKIIDSLNKYFSKPSEKTVLELAICILSQKLYETGNSCINFKVEKISRLGGYNGGTIIISSKILKSAKKTKNLIQVLDTVFHEFCHFLQDNSNKEILEKGENYEKYLPNYTEKKFDSLYKELFDDLEMEIFAHIIFYNSNKNEYLARKYAHKNTCEFINNYGLKGYTLKSFQEQEKEFQAKAYSSIRELIYIKPFIIECIQKYQIESLNKGLDNLIESQQECLLNSFILTTSKQGNQMLVKAIQRCKNKDIKNKFYTNPVVINIFRSIEKQQEC